MRPSACAVGQRVRSFSDGFTRGWVGTVTEIARGGDPPEPVAFVDWDGRVVTAVAIRLIESEVLS